MGKRTETERLANVGVPLKLKKFGDVELQVRELALEDIVTLTSDLALVLEVFGGDKLKAAVAGKSKGTEGIEMLAAVLAAEPTLQAIRKVAAASTDRKPEEFKGMGISDWLKLVKAIKDVTNWEELSEVFFDLFPTLADSLKAYLPKTKAAAGTNPQLT